MKKVIYLLFFAVISCQSTRGGNVSVSKSYPPSHCREVGQVIGHAHSRENSYNKSVEDLRHEAALKSGNYVRILAVSAHGAVIRGMAYQCR